MTSAAPPSRTEAVPAWKRLLPLLVTVAIFYFIFQKVPFARFVEALQQADYPRFLALMIPNSMFYFCWDTLVLAYLMRWFHGPIRFRELLPARAVTYVVSLANTHVARGALAYYLTRKLRMPFFELASTVIFNWLVDLTHLAVWATCGMAVYAAILPGEVFWLPLAFVAFWFAFLLYVRGNVAPWRLLLEPLAGRFPQWRERLRVREWALLRTFREAPLKRYGQFILLRAPMFFVALVFHYFAVRTFGIEIPLGRMLALLPIIFMLASLPITVAHLGTTQAAWIFFFQAYASAPRLLAYSLASHLAFVLGRALLGLIFLPVAYRDLVGTYRRSIAEPAMESD